MSMSVPVLLSIYVPVSVSITYLKLTAFTPYSSTWLILSIAFHFTSTCFIKCWPCDLNINSKNPFFCLSLCICRAYPSFLPLISLLLKILMLQKGMKMKIDFPFGPCHDSSHVTLLTNPWEKYYFLRVFYCDSMGYTNTSSPFPQC